MPALWVRRAFLQDASDDLVSRLNASECSGSTCQPGRRCISSPQIHSLRWHLLQQVVLGRPIPLQSLFGPSFLPFHVAYDIAKPKRGRALIHDIDLANSHFDVK